MKAREINFSKLILSGFMIFVFLFSLNQAFAADLVPNTFSAGEVISASEMNANFNSLEQAINTVSSDLSQAINTVYSTIRWIEDPAGNTFASSSDTATATCLANEVITGGTCSCTATNFNSSISNWGSVWFCDIVGKSVIGVCASRDLLYDSNKYGPPIKVYAICASATTVEPSISPLSVTESSPSDEALDEIKRIEDEKAAFNKMVVEKYSNK